MPWYLIAPVVAYAGIVGILYMKQRKLLYRPDDHRPSIQEAGAVGMSVVSATTEDGLTLEGWYRPAAPDRPTFLYLQGNAGHIGMRAEKANLLGERGYGVLLAGYRGFGGNPGEPSEEGLCADGRAWLSLLTELDLPLSEIVLYGESLGSGIVAELARDHPVRAAILEAPYTSVAAIAARLYWYAPVDLLIRDRFDTLSRIGQVRCPVLIVHGSEDTFIPAAHGRMLFEAAPDPKRLEIIQGAAHTDLFACGAVDPIEDFLSGLAA